MKRRLITVLITLMLILGMSVTVLADPGDPAPIPPAPTSIELPICFPDITPPPPTCDCDN